MKPVEWLPFNPDGTRRAARCGWKRSSWAITMRLPRREGAVTIDCFARKASSDMNVEITYCQQ
jgi:hypothetical protein